MSWINPKTIIGPPAEGDKYLSRPEINDLFWNSIRNGEHILFTAPRRVGKSSVMKDLVKNTPSDIIAIYQDVESDGRADEFSKRLWTLIVQQLNGVSNWKSRITTWIKGRSIGEISMEGTVKFERVQIDFKQELLDLIEEVGKEGQQIVLLLDEFPDVINNVRKKEGDDQAVELLHVMRAIRHEEKFKQFSLVLAGSIGLEHVVSSVDRIKLINDLRRIPIGALESHEVDALLNLMLDDATIHIDAAEREYLKKTIGHWLPFFFQLMVVKCNDLAYQANSPKITTAVIDDALKAILAEHEHFIDWEERLKKYLEPTDYNYCIDLLTRCAHSDFYLQHAYDFSKSIHITKGYKSLIDDVLVKDGYLILEGSRLQFLSPFLKAWWQNRHPDFEIGQ